MIFVTTQEKVESIYVLLKEARSELDKLSTEEASWYIHYARENVDNACHYLDRYNQFVNGK